MADCIFSRCNAPILVEKWERQKSEKNKARSGRNGSQTDRVTKVRSSKSNAAKDAGLLDGRSGQESVVLSTPRGASGVRSRSRSGETFGQGGDISLSDSESAICPFEGVNGIADRSGEDDPGYETTFAKDRSLRATRLAHGIQSRRPWITSDETSEAEFLSR